MKINQLTFIEADSNYEKSKVIIFGVPFDGTTTFRPGTRFAPNIIRNESYGLETFSPMQNLDLLDFEFSDIGDIETVFGNPAKVMSQIKNLSSQIHNDQKIPFMIGGEHLVTLGALQAAVEKHPDLHIIHFDAHTDLREDYLGEKLSHSSVMRLGYELVGPNKIFQFGIRSGLKSEFEWAKDKIFMNKFNLDNLDKVIDKLADKPVYITIDLDVLDPSVFPGTGTPEPGGISFNELANAIFKFQKLNNIVAADIVELAPNYDSSGISNAAAAKVVRELILAINKIKER
jgi:agmatinase